MIGDPAQHLRQIRFGIDPVPFHRADRNMTAARSRGPIPRCLSRGRCSGQINRRRQVEGVLPEIEVARGPARKELPIGVSGVRFR